MKKKFPKFNNDSELESFIENSDLSEYLDGKDLSPAKFSIKEQDTSVTIRMSGELLKYIKALAQIDNIKYQKYIKMILEKFIFDKVSLLRKPSRALKN